MAFGSEGSTAAAIAIKFNPDTRDEQSHCIALLHAFAPEKGRRFFVAGPAHPWLAPAGMLLILLLLLACLARIAADFGSK